MNIPQIDLASNVTDFYGFIQITILFVLMCLFLPNVTIM